MLKFKLQRMYRDEEMTLGHLEVDVDPLWSGYTVERPWLDNEPYVSCIPAGTYKAFARVSPSNGNVIELMDVPGRTFIQFHVANWAWQLEGCIGVGWERKIDGVGKSGPAMEDLCDLSLGQEIEVVVIDPPHLPERRGDEIQAIKNIPVKEIPTTKPEMPKEWLEPVQYEKALKAFVGKLRRDFKRRQIVSTVLTVVGLVASVRYPVIHKIQEQVKHLYEIITNKQVNIMPESKGTLAWIKARFKEPTTWAGITLAFGLAGYTISPELAEAIGMAGAGVIAAILIFLKERRVKKELLEEE